MDYLSPGFRELVRLVRRTWYRAGVLFARRQLAKAETHLGLLGWQQADFDAETQRQVDAIQHVEREQAALTNRAAELAHELEKLAEERAKVRAEFAAQRLALEAERSKAREPLVEIERLLHVLAERDPDVNRRTAELEREERESDAHYHRLLLIQPQTSEVRDQVMRLRERLIAIPNEKNDLKTQHARAVADTQQHEQARREIDQRTAEFDRQLWESKAAADARDAAFSARVRELEKERSHTEASSERLERAKLDPYREIGRVLGDSGVAPMNQPQALARVLKLRRTIVEREAAVVESLQRTAQEDTSFLRISLALWAVIVLAALLIIGALF